MKTFRFLKYALLILITINISTYAQEKVTARIDSLMQIAYLRGIFNGNVLVVRNGTIIYRGSFGYADAGKKNKLSDSMLFDIGSVSKEFNGAGIMILKAQKKLSLDDAVSMFIPGLPDWAGKVKIRHLINYTSGIPIFDPLALETDDVIMQNLKTLKALKFTPGTAYIYNHYNVYLQKRIIEKVSKMSYADFIRKNIFEPCKMKNAVIDYPVNGPRMAKAFDGDFRPAPYVQGMTGWVRLTAEDLYRWADCLDHFRLIPEPLYRELAANFPGGESSIGTSVFHDNKLILHQHQGSNSNYEALLYNTLSDNVTIVMMTNNQQMKVHGLRAAILAAIKNEPVIVPKKSVYLEIRGKMLKDINNGLTYYNKLKAEQQENYDFSFEIGDLISTGKFLQRRGHLDEAIRIFSLAVELKGKPADISYGYELIGECHLKKGDKSSASVFYRKAIEVDPGNKNALGIFQEIKKDL